MEDINQTCRDEIKMSDREKDLLSDIYGRLITAEERICDQEVQAITLDHNPP